MTVEPAPAPALLAVGGEPVVLVAGEDAPAVDGLPFLGAVEVGAEEVPLPAALVELRSVLRDDGGVLSLEQPVPATSDTRHTICKRR